MPIWEVSEPYISVWLYDQPLGYAPGLGYPISFKLAYKQREARVPSDHYFNFGPMWNSSWLTYISVDTDPTMISALGGEREYAGIDTYYSPEKLQGAAGGGTTNYTLSYPNGAKDYYNTLYPSITINGKAVALLTDKVDPFGHTNRFIYQHSGSLVLLQYVVDADGRTNTLAYTNTTYPTRVTGVQDPYGRTTILKYSDTGKLTNVVDVAGLSSSFKYDYQGWVTNLITPYGTTTFTYSTNNSGTTNEFDTPAGGTEDFIIRSVKVIDPENGTNIYMLRQRSDGDPGVPDTYSIGLANYQSLPWSFDDTLTEYRDSFHWGPKQASGLPIDLTSLSASDYRKARMRH